MVNTYHRAQSDLVILNDEDHRQTFDGGKVEGFVRGSRFYRAVADPRESHPVLATQLKRQGQADRDRRDIADVRNRWEDPLVERSNVPVAAPR